MQTNGEKDFNLFANLPRDITLNILLRLPIQSIIKFKLVCREFHNVVESREFFELGRDRHLIISPIPYVSTARICKIKDRGLSLEPEELCLPDHIWDPAHTSVNGLILIVCQQHVIIFNPITREYARLPNPPDLQWFDHVPNEFGFGMSRTGEYKVVQIFQESEYLIYTLGTRHWRKVGVGAPPLLRSQRDRNPVFVGGNIHWLCHANEAMVSCFNLETEVLTYLPTPPRRHHRAHVKQGLSVLDDCLCLCDVGVLEDSNELEINIWLMRDGGNWSRKIVMIWEGHDRFISSFFPIKVFEDGAVLLWSQANMHYFKAEEGGRRCSSKLWFSGSYFSIPQLYTPCFLPLKTLFPEEVIRSF